MAPPFLDPEDVIAIASLLNLGDGAFIVGGQATNLWAERYALRAEELWQYGPFTSVDVDYFGHRGAAEKLAKALNGTLRLPEFGDATPNSAIVEVDLNGKHIIIDFIHSVLGVKPRDMRVTELLVPAKSPPGTVLTIPVMHPVACLKSRIANVLGLQRRDSVAIRQLRATHVVVIEFISEALDDGDFRHAEACLQELFEYLRSDEFGRRAHVDVPIDVLPIIRRFDDDPRLPEGYRTHNIPSMIKTIECRRAGRT